MSRIRLDKFLSEMGCGTRKEVRELLKKGCVTVNGAAVKQADRKVDTEMETVAVSGREISYTAFEYWMLHKPAGVVSATEDAREKTVLSLLPMAVRKDLFPVGRLDKDTEGLLLITNDGALAHRLLSPKSHVDKTYEARVEGHVTETDVKAFLEGIDIGDEKPTLPARLTVLKEDAVSEVRITIREGRYHQIKRMFEAVGKKVIYLKRISMGTLMLDEALPAGEARRLTRGELEQLKALQKGCV